MLVYLGPCRVPSLKFETSASMHTKHKKPPSLPGGAYALTPFTPCWSTMVPKAMQPSGQQSADVSRLWLQSCIGVFPAILFRGPPEHPRASGRSATGKPSMEQARFWKSTPAGGSNQLNATVRIQFESSMTLVKQCTTSGVLGPCSW